jgi:hypothetical protein
VIVKIATPLLSGCVCVEVGEGAVLKVTDPVGVPTDDVTVTVTVPFAPKATAGALIPVVVAAGVTVWVKMGDVDDE